MAAPAPRATHADSEAGRDPRRLGTRPPRDTGGNDDGFSGRHSSLGTENGRLVLLDLEGPGVVHRIRTPTPTDDTLEFYFDGERAPRLRVRSSDLFSGDVFPFVRPVVGNEGGGFYSYVPVPFARSLRVLFTGRKITFHQFQYRLYGAAGGGVRSYPREWGDAERRALARAQAEAFAGAATTWARSSAPGGATRG